MEPPVLAVPDRPQVFKHILAPAPITMKPYSLIFSSEAVEEQFALSRFRAACRPFVGFCGVTILLCVLAALLHPDFAEGYIITIITYSVIIAARLHLDSMSDQRAARVRFGRGLFWWGSIIWVFTILHLNTNPPEPSGALIAVVVSILWSGVPVYLRLTAFDKTYYAPPLLVDALGVGLLPNWSVLGRPAETICVYGALLIGELIGYTLEQHVRKGWLQVQELLADKSQLNELRALLARIDVVRAFDVNGWEAAGVLGRGRYGLAILLRDASSGSLCVSKKIATEGMDDEGFEVLANEMRVASSLDHPYLIAFKGFYISDTAACCLVFEYAGGGTLQQIIDKHARRKAEEEYEDDESDSSFKRRQEREGRAGFETAVIRNWILQMSKALIYMHERRVVHRDVKASNIFLSNDLTTTKLGDFGISKVMTSVSSAGHTVCGTPSYMCPEVLRGEGCGPPGDVWALGVVLFQLLALRVPFKPPAHAHAYALMMLITKFDGTLDEDATLAIESCGHPDALRRLASGGSMLHPQPTERTALEEVVAVLEAVTE